MPYQGLSLSEKGDFAPPPMLAGQQAQALSQKLAALPGVIARTHWYFADASRVDGADFYVGNAELGHLHLDGEAHIAVGGVLRDALVKKRLARAFRWSKEFVTWPVDTAEQKAHAEWLFSLRYEVLTGVSEKVLAQKVLARA